MPDANSLCPRTPGSRASSIHADFRQGETIRRARGEQDHGAHEPAAHMQFAAREANNLIQF